MNPAMAGYNQQTEIRATLAQQWIGIAGAPSTQSISAHTNLGKGLGFGGYLYNDKNGLNKETGFNLTGAYHIELGENQKLLKVRKLSFGLGVSGFQHTVNLAEFTEHDYDPAVDGAEKSAFAMDFNVGTFFRYDGLFAGFSAAGFGFQKLSIYNDATEPNFPTHLFLNVGYLFSSAEKLLIQPSVVYKFNTNKHHQIDINLKAIYLQLNNQQYWIAMSLRRNLDKDHPQFLDLIAMAGLNYSGFLFAYAYDFGLSELNSSHSGSHQIMLGFSLKRAKKHCITCPVF